MSRTLRRKVLRDLLGMKGQVAAIALILACGVASYVTVLSAYRGLTSSRDAYYADYRMPDLFAPVKKAPVAVARQIEAIPGVRRVRSRVVFDVTIDVPAVLSPCSGRVLSLPDDGSPVIGDIHMTRGRGFEGDGDRQAIVGDRFARKHGLLVGDRLQVVMNNRKEGLRIVGTAIAPEFVYMIRGGEILPDPVHFTVLWLSTSFAESVFDFEDSCNEFVASLDRQAVLGDVLAECDRILDRYGSLGAYGVKDQPSSRYLHEEIKGLEGSATFVPSIFLGVAAFVLHVLMGRLVRSQRTQLAVLRAYGYDTRQLVISVLAFVLIIGAIGAVLGTGVGLWFSRSMAQMYREFYDFPVLVFGFDSRIVFTAIGVSLGFSVLGAVSAAVQVARLEPAEGMRPEAPRAFRRTIIERWGWLWDHLGFVWRMVVRGILRARFRSAVTALGVALSASILLLAFFTEDSMQVLADYQFAEVERQDVRVAFNAYRGRSALNEIRRLPGVRTAEPELSVPVRLLNGWRERRTALQGLDPDGVLRGLRDRRLGPVELPRDGLLLSAKLAELLAVRVGEDLTVEVLDGRKSTVTARVSGLLDEFIGTSAYVSRHRLSRWIGEEDAMTGALLRVDPREANRLDRSLKRLPAVESAVFKSQSRENFDRTLAESMGIMTGTLIIFAGIISFGVIYNSSRISLEVRRRELASLRVLGFTKREVGAILVRESLLLTIIAVPLGIGIGAGFCHAMSSLYQSDLYRFPVVIRDRGLILTALWVIGFTLVAGWLVSRRVAKLDLVEVLKARE